MTELVEEQAALRRVATLVAREVSPTEVFGAIAEEIGRLIGTEEIRMERFDADGTAVVVGSWGHRDALPLGSRRRLEGDTAAARVLRTGRPARIDGYADAGGPYAELGRAIGIHAVASAPIVVGGQLWGVISTGATDDTPLPPDAELRLASFTELMATAIANADARAELQRLVDEQAALLRLATLVAEGATHAETFSAVSEEVERLFGSDAVVVRFEEDGLTIVSVGASSGAKFPAGTRWPLEEGMASLEVLRTRRRARIDGGRSHVASSASSPILVEDRVWGAITVFSTDNPLPTETDERLERFAQLVATAIANADSREAVLRLAAEQAALRRVATLVAEDASPPAIFEAVSVEVDQLFNRGEDTCDIAGVVKFEPGREHLVVGVSRTLDFVPLGSRWPPIELYAPTRVMQTGRPARVDESEVVAAGGPEAEFLQQVGLLSQVASPIVVGGRVWGAISVNAEAALPHDAEERLEKFTELVATAIAKGESHEALTAIANEQAALRRVATLVARDAPSAEIFEAVATEVGNLFQTDITLLGRYDSDGYATSIGNWTASGHGVPVGTRAAVGGRNVLTLVAETGKPARIDGYDDASGEAADIARAHGWRSSIAAPIIVEGQLWGAMLVATEKSQSFPASAEDRLAAFTDLIATAVANAQAHDELQRFGAEQAALGRVATLVADGSQPERVFEAVVTEVSALLRLERIELVRYDGDATGTVIAASGDHPFPAGTTWSLDDPSVMATVAHTGRPARIDDYGSLTGEIARAARGADFRSAIGAPITVAGRLWGVIIAISTDPDPIPEQSQARLAQLTELIATAIANAESRAEIERLADEQAALRRVATLVARGAQPAEIFSAVTGEVGRLFDTGLAIVGRFEDDPPAVVAVAVGKAMVGIDIGSIWILDDPTTAPDLFPSRRAVRASVPARPRSRALADTIARLGVTSMVASPIIVDDRLWGELIVPSLDDLPADTEERLEKFTDLVNVAIANAEGKAELAASRRRIVTASDEERRRIERNLHDGTQQRLVSLGLAVRAAEASLPAGEQELHEQLSRIALGLADAVEDLQKISRGIHPAILARGGLGAALRMLAARSPIPVHLDLDLEARLPEPVEVAAYYVASEALANTAKHSQATRIEVSLARRSGRVLLMIRDDGVGGASVGRGSGLVGLTDRVEALGGSIRVDSSTGGGTRITAELPVE